MAGQTQDVSGRALLERAKAAIGASQAIAQAVKEAAAQLPPRPVPAPPQGPSGPPT